MYIELDSKRSKSVHQGILSYGPFSNEKTTFQWSKVVSEAIFPTN